MQFGFGFYSFQFQGERSGLGKNYLVATSDFISPSIDEQKDLCEDLSKFIWEFFGLTLLETDVVEREDLIALVFRFEGGKSFCIWNGADTGDNLITLIDQDTSKEQYLL